MTIPTGRNLRQWKPWYKRYWLIRGKRREDKQARLVVLATFLALAPIVFVLASGGETRVYLPIAAHSLPPDPAAELLDLVNAARVEQGCGPLTRQPQLAQAAQDWSTHMAADDVFQHRDMRELASVYGYPFTYVGENIAAGSPTAQTVFALWMSSDGHRRNILNCRFQDIGIGLAYLNPDDAPLRYGYYWTQVFGQPAGPNAAAANLEESQASDTPMDTPDGLVAPDSLVAPAYPPPE